MTARADTHGAGSEQPRLPRLVLVAHGTRDPEGQKTIGRLVEAVRARLPEVDVALAWVDVIGPEPSEILADGVPSVLVPAFLGHGYHVGHDLPEAMRTAPGPVVVTEHLGVVDEVVEALADRLREAGWKAPGPGPGPAEQNRPSGRGRAVVLAGAGSSSDRAVAEARSVGAALAQRLGVTVIPGFAVTAEPSVPDAVRQASTEGDDVAISTYLLAPGFFADRVRMQSVDADETGVPASEGPASGDRSPLVVSNPIGVHPAIVDLLVRRYREAPRLP